MLNQPLGLGQLQNLEGVDLTSVDTNYPVLATGQYPFTISSVKNDLTKDKLSEMIVIDFKLDTPVSDVRGKTVAAGFKLTHRIGITPGEKRTGDMIVKDLARLFDAVYGRAGRDQIMPHIGSFDTANLVNQQVMVRTKIEPEGNGYPERTGIASFIEKSGEVPQLPGL